MLLAVLFSSMSAHAAVTDTKIMLQAQPVSVVADTLAKVREGSVNAGGVNWACSGVRCNTMASAAAAPLALCQGLAREVGALRSFIVANRPLNGNELQQCNSVAPVVAAALPGMKTPQGAGLPPAAPVPSVGLLPLQPPPRLDKAPVTGFATPQAPALPALKPVQTPNPQMAIPELKPPAAVPAPQFTPPLKVPPVAVPVVVKPPIGDASVTTPALTMTGIRASPASITTALLTMTGVRASPASITTAQLTMTGVRARSVTVTTGQMTMTGTR